MHGRRQLPDTARVPQQDEHRPCAGRNIKAHDAPRIWQEALSLPRLTTRAPGLQILKQDWPHKWKTFIPDIVGASRTSETLCENCMVGSPCRAGCLFGVQSVQSALLHDVHYNPSAASSILESTMLSPMDLTPLITGDSEAAQRGGVRLFARRADAGKDKGAQNVAECRLSAHTRAQPLGPERWREARFDQVEFMSWCVTAADIIGSQYGGQAKLPKVLPAELISFQLLPSQTTSTANAGRRWLRCMHSSPGSRWATSLSPIWWRSC